MPIKEMVKKIMNANEASKLTLMNRVVNLFLPSSRTGQVGGNVLANASVPYPGGQITTQQMVKAMEPYGIQVPKHIKERASGWSQPANISEHFDFKKVQGAFRAAERGDMTMLFTFYRDFFTGTGIVASQWGKRKLATISEPFDIIPFDKKNTDDVIAAKAIKQILSEYSKFDEILIHIMNDVVFPVAVVEKNFEAVTQEDFGGNNEFNLRYKIKQLLPVDYQLITYRLPYLPQGPIYTGNQPALTGIPNGGLPLMQSLTGKPEDTIYDPDSWEPNLRFWSVFDNGLVNYSFAYMQSPDPNRHIISRSNLLQGVSRDNFGGLGKPILWWAIMSQLGVDVFLKCLQKYGLPFITAKVDTSQIDTVNQMVQTFSDVNGILNMIAVNKDAVIGLEQMNYSNAAEAHKIFVEMCNDQISLLLVGQTLDSKSSTGGLGTGKDSLQSQVRKDIINYDQKHLNNVLRFGLFKQLLQINGIKGNMPNIVWGGDSESDLKDLSSSILNLSNAGIKPSPDSLEALSEKFGFKLEFSATEEQVPSDKKEIPAEEQPKEPDVQSDNSKG